MMTAMLWAPADHIGNNVARIIVKAVILIIAIMIEFCISGNGTRIYLKISGTYNENVLSFAGGLSKVADHPVRITINRQTTAKQ